MGDQREYQRNREGSKIGKIVIDRDLCIAAQSCIAPGGSTYQLDGENKIVVVNPDSVDDDALLASAQACPTKAILLFDKEGKQIA